MDGRAEPTEGLTGQVTNSMHGHMRKRQRSNPGPDSLGYDDFFGSGPWRYSSGMSPVSDPDIDYNAQSSKRYLSEVMANNLTRHMNLRPSSSAGGPPGPAAGPDDPTCLPHPHHPSLPFASPHSYAHTGHHHPHHHAYGPAPLTPPGGCSPQRTAASEMSEGPDPASDILQPMLTSDVSLSLGNRGSGNTADSTSETADSDLLEERERSVSVSTLGPGGGGMSMAWASIVAGVAGLAGSGGVGATGPPGSSHPGLPHRGGTAAGAAGTNAAYGLGLGTGLGCIGSAAGPLLHLSGLPVSPGSPILTGGGAGPLSALPTRRVSDAQGGTGLPIPHPYAHLHPHQHQQQQYAQMMGQQGSAAMMRSPFRSLMPATRGSLTEIPTSPSDTRFGGLDLRKTALLRSLSRRTEDAVPDAGGATTAAALGLPAIAQPLATVPEGGAAAGAASAVTIMASTFTSRFTGRLGAAAAPPPPPPQLQPRLAGSRSDSAISDGMSEGCGGGGLAGMETNSISMDGVGMLAGPLDDACEELQQQAREGSGEARPPASSLAMGQGGDSLGMGARLGPSRSVSECSPPTGFCTVAGNDLRESAAGAGPLAAAHSHTPHVVGPGHGQAPVARQLLFGGGVGSGVGSVGSSPGAAAAGAPCSSRGGGGGSAGPGLGLASVLSCSMEPVEGLGQGQGHAVQGRGCLNGFGAAAGAVGVGALAPAARVVAGAGGETSTHRS